MRLRLTKAVKSLLIIYLAVFLIQQTADQYLGGNLLGLFGLVPANVVIKHYFWQVITYAFLHGDVTHLFLNGLMLLFIGSELEALWGTARFIRYYFSCLIGAATFYLLLQLAIFKGEWLAIPMVGASGAIYGLLMAYGLIFSERVLLFMMIFPMKAKHFIWILAGLEFMATVFSSKGGLSGLAHLGGLISGFVYLWAAAARSIAKKKRAIMDSSQATKSKKTSSRNHLKLIIDNERKKVSGVNGNADGNTPKTWH
ncbi:MAG: rhomboid family intramembrane serine protease [Bdellovibrionota bacterium]